MSFDMLKRILKSTFVVDHPAGSRALLFPETNDGNNTRGLAPILQKLNKEEYETPQKCAADIRAVLQRTLQEAETKRGKETTTRTAILSVCQALFEKKYKVVQETYQFDDPLVEAAATVPPKGSRGSTKGRNTGTEECPKTESSDTKEGNNNTNPSLEAMQSPDYLIPLDTKARLGANLLLLNGREWGHVLRLLERQCPAALDRIAPDHVEIVIDALDKDVFREVATYADHKTLARRLGHSETPVVRRRRRRKRSRVK